MQITLLVSLESDLGIPEWAGYIIVFVLGACIGSFLNVLIYRLPNDLSLWRSSKCPNCDERIKPYHNIPIVGWLMLRGKCANCKEPFGWRYPAVELLTALVFMLVYWQFGFVTFLPVALIFAAAMIALVFIDAEHMILPNAITYPLFVLVLIARVVYPLLPQGFIFTDMKSAPIIYLHESGYPDWVVSLAGALFGALVGAGLLWIVGAIWKLLRGVDAMGLGDVKMMLGVGALLGWRLALLTIFLAAFTGAIAGIVVLLTQKNRNLQTQIPFGVFLGIGSIVSMLFGARMIHWYLEQF